MKPDVLDFALSRIENELADMCAQIMRIKKEPYERIEAHFHGKVVNGIKQIVALAENVEAAFKDNYSAGLKP
jgi:hypothetical protein